MDWLLPFAEVCVFQCRSQVPDLSLVGWCLLLAVSCMAYQYVRHGRFWSGVWDTVRTIVQYRRAIMFQKQIYTAADSEEYVVWTPKHKAQREVGNNQTNQKHHVWICLPGGMEAIDFGFSALLSKKIFEGSHVCMFNNPGIKTKVKSRPLPSPTETEYLIEYIERIQTEQECRVSLIGFSIGSIQALRTLHDIQNDPEKQDRIKLESVVLVHAPDIVREGIEYFKHNWLVRGDVFFAHRIRSLQRRSGSWKMVKDQVNTKDSQFNARQGWPYIERVSEVSLGKDWNQCEQEMFNLRSLCDESIQKCDTRVYRIIAENDWVVPYHFIDSHFFKYLDEVFISSRGGHCGITQCPRTMSIISSLNEKALRTEGGP